MAKTKDTKPKKEKQENTETVAEAVENTDTGAQVRVSKGRSKKYVALRSQVDKTKDYTLDQAIELVKRLSRKNHKTITADVNYKETGFSTEISFPHTTGKTVRVAIANDDILKQIEDGKIEFDVLVAKPDMMGKIAKFARVLGPRGLMPNPKNKTVTPDPEARKKELEAGKVTIKTEKKAPLLHVQIGEVTQSEKELTENIQTLVKVLNPHKIQRLTISSTMSPGVKISLQEFLA